MQTHKNPTLRQGGGVPNKPAIGPKPTVNNGVAARAAPAQKPPKLELEGKKWVVEYFKNNPNVAVEGLEVNQSVYVFRCEGSTVKVSGKCNNIIFDGCKKSAVVFDSVVSSIEFINCQSVQMQASSTHFLSRMRFSSSNNLSLLLVSGAWAGADHFHRQDGRVPDVPEQGLPGHRDHHGQVLRDERGHPVRRRLRELEHKFFQSTRITSAGNSRFLFFLVAQVEQPVPEQFKTKIHGTKLATTTSETV